MGINDTCAAGEKKYILKLMWPLRYLRIFLENNNKQMAQRG
jgi:hypothetical protein